MDTWIARVCLLLRPAEARPPARFRPRVEALETRCVPTVTLSTTRIPLGQPFGIRITADEFVDGDITDNMDLPFAYKIDWKDGSDPSTGNLTVSGNNLTVTLQHRFLKPVQQVSFTEIEKGEGDTATQTANVTITFPTVAQILGDATVRAAMNTAWDDTLNYAQMNSAANLRREEGFWIEFDSSNGSYTTTKLEQPKGFGPDVPGTNKPAPVHDMPDDHLYVVGRFHTHTPTAYRTQGRPTRPSNKDTNFANAIMMPEFVYDYKALYAPPGYPLRSPADVFTTGPNQRADTELMFSFGD